MKLWERMALAFVSLVALYFLWRHEFHGLEIVVLIGSALLMGRLLHTSNVAKNPFGEERGYSIKPVITAVVKSLLCFIAAMLWIVISIMAVRLWQLPDTYLVAIGIIAGPSMALIVLAAHQFWVAMIRFQFGRKRRAL